MQWECFSADAGRLICQSNAAMYRDMRDENLLGNALGLRLGKLFIFQQHPKPTAKVLKEWFRTALNVLESDLKMAVHRHFPSYRMELEMFQCETTNRPDLGLPGLFMASSSKRL